MKTNSIITIEHINDFVSRYDILEILNIESQDPQFLCIQNIYILINGLYPDSDSAKLFLLDLVIKIALISYQLGGSGEQRWEEVLLYISEEFSDLPHEDNGASYKSKIDTLNIYISNLENINWRQTLLKKCKYNRRLINMKLKRLAKLGNLRDLFPNLNIYEKSFVDMEFFHKLISSKLGADKFAKTPLFATKIFGYIGRLIWADIYEASSQDDKKINIYPQDLSIPLDSRLRYIYVQIWGDTKTDNKTIIDFFDNLGKSNNIPPLHLDSLLRITYRNLTKNNFGL